MLGSIGKASEATETYHHVIKILELSRGEGEELIVPLSALGNLLQKEGKASDAEYTFNRLVLCIWAVFTCIYCYFMERLFHCDVYYSVFPVCTRVLNIYIRLYGEKDGRVGVAMCSLAQVKCATGMIFFHTPCQKEVTLLLWNGGR